MKITEIKKPSYLKRGSVIVDASICIGIFLLAMVSILSLILQAGTEAKDFHRLAEQAQGITSIYATEGAECESSSAESCIYLASADHSLKFRPFTGVKDNKADRLVYIFPKRGIRYHAAGCRILNSGEAERVLNSDIRKKYSPCRICRPDQLPDGACIFLYSDTTDIYHKKNCAVITKSYEKVSLSEAEKRGYSPCRICMPGSGASSDQSEN